MLPSDRTPTPLTPGIRPAWTVLFAILTAVGGAAFLLGISGEGALRAWQAYLINYIFWTGLAFGAVLFSAVLNMSYARWGRPVKRLAEAFGAFLPVSFALFWVIFFGREELFPWVRQPIPVKQAWLNVPFFFARNGVALLLLTALSLALVYYSVRADREWLAQSGQPSSAQEKKPWENSWHIQKTLSPVIGFVYAFGLSLLAFDLIMSLDPHWYSTLFGAYYFMANFYMGIAAVYLVTLLFMNSPGLREYVHDRQLHDLGKLTFAFSVFTGYLFYAQFNTIWYGNLPEETRYVILRLKLPPWEPLAWVILLMIFVIPFGLLLNRKIKLKRTPMIVLTILILTGMWLERFMLVAPSIWPFAFLPIGMLEVLITAGFFGLVALCVLLFLNRVPLVPVSDPLLREAIASGEIRGKLMP